MKNIVICTLFSIVVITGCRENREVTETETTPAIDHSQAVHPEGTGWEDDIQLDNGSQWKVNRETTEGVQSMSSTIKNRPTRTVEEYRELGNDLEQKRENLNRNQLEEGPSNDNLQIYMKPLNEKIKELQEVETLEEGARLKSELEKHLYTYSNYFV